MSEKFTAIVECNQAMFGTSSGKHGCASYKIIAPKSKVRDKSNGSLYGLPLYDVVDGIELGDGSLVKVTIEVLDAQPLRVNPWWEKEQVRRAEAEARVAERRAQKEEEQT
jgi:hypothetical protein